MSSSQIYRLIIDQKASASLDQMLQSINEVTIGMKLTKSQLASWILNHFAEQLTKHIPAIQKAHFSSIDYIQALLERKRKADKSGAPCPEFDSIADLLTNEKSATAPRGKSEKRHPSSP